MSDEELRIEIQKIKTELQKLKDIEAIRKLENAYGFYLINFMNQEIIDCFSDHPETTAEFPEGTFIGKKGIETAFGHTNKNMNPEFMHQMMQLSGVIDVATDGKTARGRWWGFGAMAIPADEEISQKMRVEGVKQALVCGIYENEFIKEDGVWKIWKLKWVPLYQCVPEHGWVKPERLSKESAETGTTKFPDWWRPNIPSKGIKYSYPSGYILPFHYKHPVTGKPTSEGLRNISVEGAI
jgi:hypothetical protein